MASLEDLRRLGWYLTPEGLQECVEEGKNSVDAITKVALDVDMKEIGAKFLPDNASKNKNDHVDGPLVLQVQKLRNVSAPKENQESQGAPPLCKLTLTDGHSSFIALEMEKINKLTLGTPPGTKVRLTGSVQVSTGFLMLNKRNCEVLGGSVEKLVENWQLKRQLANQTRFNVDSGGAGPPPFTPFGQRNKLDKSQTGSKKDNFKSLDQTKDKDLNKKVEDAEFIEQRKATIKAAMETKAEVSGKYFGSGTVLKPNDRDIAKIIEMGFTIDQAVSALKQNNNSLQNAISALLRDREDQDPSDRDRRGPRARPNDKQAERSELTHDQPYDKDAERVDRGAEARADRGRVGRRGRDDENEEYISSRPSAPATVFDIIANKITIPQNSDKEDGKDKASKELSKSFSPDSDKRGNAGPPNLPPRLVKQQRAREEERIRRISGGRPPSSSSPGLNNQRPPPPPPYAVQPTNRPQRPPISQGRYQDQGPRGPNPGLRQSYQPRPNYPRRMEYPPPKRVYDPHSRGQVPPNKILWNENDSGRRPYRDNRNYNDRYVDRDYNQGPPNQRRVPNQRYQSGYQTYQNRQMRDNNNQYSTQGQYTGPPPYYANKYNSNNDVTSRSYKQSRHQQQQNEVLQTDEQTDPVEQTPTQESSVEQDSGGTQESGSSTSDNAIEEQIQPEQVVVTESNQVDDGYITSEIVDDSQYISNEVQVVQYDDTAMMATDQGVTTYVYTDGYAPPAMIQQMQALSIQSAPVSAPVQAYQPYTPGVVMDQSQMYAPAYSAVLPNMEYTNSSIGMADATTSSTVVNGTKNKNNNDALKQNARQWKSGDYCMAKYWEDQKFYRAIVNGMDPSGTYCFVTFPDYGNTEQVVISDIRPVPKTAWDTNTIQSPPPMPLPGMVAGSQGAILMAPPGIPIQSPPALSFMSAPFPQPEQSFQGSMVSVPAGAFTYAPVATTMATAQYNTKQPVQQHIYVQQPQMVSQHPQMIVSQPQMTSQVQLMTGQPQMVTSQSMNKK